MSDTPRTPIKREWIRCPVCEEPDMRCETVDEEENQLVFCVNHACASNNGNNATAILTEPYKRIVSLEHQLAEMTKERDKLRDANSRLGFLANEQCDKVLASCELSRATTERDKLRAELDKALSRLAQAKESEQALLAR